MTKEELRRIGDAYLASLLLPLLLLFGLNALAQQQSPANAVAYDAMGFEVMPGAQFYAPLRVHGRDYYPLRDSLEAFPQVLAKYMTIEQYLTWTQSNKGGYSGMFGGRDFLVQRDSTDPKTFYMEGLKGVEYNKPLSAIDGKDCDFYFRLSKKDFKDRTLIVLVLPKGAQLPAPDSLIRRPRIVWSRELFDSKFKVSDERFGDFRPLQPSVTINHNGFPQNMLQTPWGAFRLALQSTFFSFKTPPKTAARGVFISWIDGQMHRWEPNDRRFIRWDASLADSVDMELLKGWLHMRLPRPQVYGTEEYIAEMKVSNPAKYRQIMRDNRRFEKLWKEFLAEEQQLEEENERERQQEEKEKQSIQQPAAPKETPKTGSPPEE